MLFFVNLIPPICFDHYITYSLPGWSLTPENSIVKDLRPGVGGLGLTILYNVLTNVSSYGVAFPVYLF